MDRTSRRGFGIAAILILIAAAALLGGGFWAYQKYGVPSFNKGAVCTDDAKQCPDGSYVGRSGPNCEFTACPPEPEGNGVSAPVPPDLWPYTRPSVSEDYTVGWKTYRSEKYGFEVKYPSTWTFSDYTKGFKNMITLSFGAGDYQEGILIDVNCWIDEPTQYWGFYSQIPKAEKQIHVAMVDTKVITSGDNFLIPLLKEGQYNFGGVTMRTTHPIVTYRYCGLQLYGTSLTKVQAVLDSFSFTQGFDATIENIVGDFQHSQHYITP